MIEFVLRFFIGGIVVSVFAILSDLFSPKSFSGLFAAAPSVALATLALAFGNQGAEYASVEARSMLAGAAALGIYSQFTAWSLKQSKFSTVFVVCFGVLVWFGVAFGFWLLLLR